MPPSTLGLDSDPSDLSDLRVERVAALLPPSCVVEELPGDPTTYANVIATRKNVTRIVQKKLDKMIIVLNPKQPNETDKVLKIAKEIKGFITKGFGESFGEHAQLLLMLQPTTAEAQQDDQFGPSNPKLRHQRDLLLQVNRLGVPTAANFDDTVTPQYFADLISWASVSAKSEMLRELVSGLSMPVGLCADHGNIHHIASAIRQSATAHHFLGVSAEGLCGIVESTGNDDTQGVVHYPYDSAFTVAQNIAKAEESLRHDTLSPDFSNAALMLDINVDTSEEAAEALVLMAVRNPSIPGIRLAFDASDDSQWVRIRTILERTAAAVKHVQINSMVKENAQRDAPTDNLRIRSVRPLLPPACLLEELPRKSDHQLTVVAGRAAVQNAISGESGRLVVLVGPPLADDPAPLLEFAARISQLRKEVGSELEIVLRCGLVGTAGESCPGMLKDPDRDGSFQVNRGIRLARDMLLRANRLGVPTAAFFTDTATPQYFADLVSFASVSAQSEMLRTLISGLSMPAGLRTPIRDMFEAAADLRSAADPQRFFGVTSHGIAGIVRATGNADCVVGVTSEGVTASTFMTDVKSACANRNSPPLFVYTGGPGVCTETQMQFVDAIVESIECGQATSLRGVVLDSYLLAGARVPTPDAIHGISIADACIDWTDTTRAIRALAAAVKNAAHGTRSQKRQKM